MLAVLRNYPGQNATELKLFPVECDEDESLMDRECVLRGFKYTIKDDGQTPDWSLFGSINLSSTSTAVQFQPGLTMT